MNFEIGDKVVHQVHGVGEIIHLEEKTLAGHTAPYYRVKIRDLSIWVPIEEGENYSLRLPTPTREFKALFKILSSSNEPLPDERNERRLLLTELLKSEGLEGVCRVVRDLSKFRQGKSMYDAEKALLERAENLLLDEWSLSLAIPRAEAERQLRRMLASSGDGTSEPASKVNPNR